MRISIAFALIFAFLVCLGEGAVDCKPEVEFSGGDVYQFDLTPLCHKKGEADYQCIDDEYNTYYFNICGATNEASTGDCAGAAVCQLSAVGDYNNAGTLESQKFYPNNEIKPGQGIVVHYEDGKRCSKGDARNTTIFIQCDKYAEDPIISQAVSEYCAFFINVSSKYGCGKKLEYSSSNSGSNSGSSGCTMRSGIALVILMILMLFWV